MALVCHIHIREEVVNAVICQHFLVEDTDCGCHRFFTTDALVETLIHEYLFLDKS